MNIKRLKQSEARFLAKYNKAFNDEELLKIRKKHNIQKHINNIHNICSKESFKQGLNIYEDVTKIVLRSSLVSVFEKVRFRDLVKELDLTERNIFLEGVYELIHGDEEYGMETLYNLLSPYKLAKWPIITIFRAYYYPDDDIFIKPTTVKNVIKTYELEDIKYTPKVNYPFYKKYRAYFNELKKHVSKDLSPSNPAFSGFLMSTFD